MLQKTSLSQMLFLSDNMAYFPYQVQDEPLFIIHHIDIMISVTGTNLLQSFREVSTCLYTIARFLIKYSAKVGWILCDLCSYILFEALVFLSELAWLFIQDQER